MVIINISHSILKSIESSDDSYNKGYLLEYRIAFKDKEDYLEVKFSHKNCLYKIQTYLYEASDISFLIHSFKYYNEL